MDPKILQQEKNKLSAVQKHLRDAKKTLEESVNAIGEDNLATLKEMRENPETNGADFFFFMEQLHEKNLTFNFKDKFQRLEEIDALLKETYFARLDMQEKDKPEERIYIGKFGFTDEAPIIIDWRAKIASVYYRYRYPQKNVKYDTPDGEIVKDLTLKRTFEIDDGEMVKYYNNDIQLDEGEIISGKISKRTGGVLEDIVETIQEGQLDIIEADPRQLCIVQGCVGSGKSTVAIHKLSHIFFNHQKLITPERSILIAKNQILVGYLSTLFPKLGIFDINYKSLRDLVVNIIFAEGIKINFDFSINPDTSRFNLEELEKIDDKISKVHDFYEAEIDKVLGNDEYESFAGFIYNRSDSVYGNITEFVEELEEELDIQQFNIKEHAGSVKEWVWKENVRKLKKLNNVLKKLRTTAKETTFLELVTGLGINIHRKLGYYETLIVLYVYYSIIGFRNVKKFEYCVVDEGQDFSILEYLILGKAVINGRFCILGDLNQSYQADGLSEWDAISRVIKEAKTAQTFVLDTNYRSTKPIIDLANKILSPYTKNYLPKSINRKGVQPTIELFGTPDEILKAFSGRITAEVQDLDKSIGVICFDDSLFEAADKILSESNIDPETYIKLDDKKRIVYLPKGVYLSHFNDCKGLEFAKVYILGLNLGEVHNYSDAKKAFVAVTRAMNDVIILGEK